MAKKCDRDALCRELLIIEKRNAGDFARIDEIKALLKGDAGGINFKIVVAGLGEVTVSAPKPERLEGTRVELVMNEFMKLPTSRQEKLIEQGLVATVPILKKAYYGGVTPKLY